jgi:hypothetical protein
LGGPYRFPGIYGSQHIRDPTWSQNPFLSRLGNGSRSCFVGFRCFGNTSCSFHFAFISCHFPFIILSCSFHLYSCPLMFLHFHSNVHPCPFIFLSFACIFLSFCIHVLSFPF